MNLKSFVKVVGKHLAENKVNYLTAAGIALEAAAIVLTFKHAPKCKEIIDGFEEHEVVRGEKLSTEEKIEPLVKELWAPALCCAVSIGCQLGACKISNKTMKALRTLETAYTGVAAAYNLQKKEIDKLPEDQRKAIEENIAQAEKNADKAIVASAEKGKRYIQDTGEGDELIVDKFSGQAWYGTRGHCLECVDAMKKTLRRGKEDSYLHNELLADIGVRSDTIAGGIIEYKAHNDDDFIWVSFEKMDGGDHTWWIMTVHGAEMCDSVYLG